MTPPDLLTGEKLQALCEVTVTTHHIDAFHASLPSDVRRVFLEDINNTHTLNVTSVFVYTDLLPVFLERFIFARPVILVSHNGDGAVDETFRHHADRADIKHWFAQNALLVHPKVTPVPIGIANAQWPHGDLDTVSAVMAEPAPADDEKPINVLGNFDVRTNFRVRARIAMDLMSINVPFVLPVLSYKEYLREVKAAKFVVCPEGNGVCTHRLAETILMGSVPVVSSRQREYYLRMGLFTVAVDDYTRTLDIVGSAVVPASRLVAPLTLSFWRDKMHTITIQHGHP